MFTRERVARALRAEPARDGAAAGPAGRVVVEADPTVLRVRPELDVVLEPGDRLFVPRRPHSVLVTGEVFRPGALRFVPGTRVDAYIRQAGGFRRSADRERVFVVYPDGVARRVSVEAWNYNPVHVPPGGRVVVPRTPAAAGGG